MCCRRSIAPPASSVPAPSPYVMIAGTLVMAGAALYAREFLWAPILLVGGWLVSAAVEYALFKPARRRLIAEAATI